MISNTQYWIYLVVLYLHMALFPLDRGASMELSYYKKKLPSYPHLSVQWNDLQIYSSYINHKYYALHKYVCWSTFMEGYTFSYFHDAFWWCMVHFPSLSSQTRDFALTLTSNLNTCSQRPDISVVSSGCLGYSLTIVFISDIEAHCQFAVLWECLSYNWHVHMLRTLGYKEVCLYLARYVYRMTPPPTQMEMHNLWARWLKHFPTEQVEATWHWQFCTSSKYEADSVTFFLVNGSRKIYQRTQWFGAPEMAWDIWAATYSQGSAYVGGAVLYTYLPSGKLFLFE